MNVLYWGHDDRSPVPYFRGGQFSPYLAENDISAAYVWLFDPRPEAIPLAWPDVAVFRRFYKDDVTERAWDAADCARIYDADDYDLGTPTHNPWAEATRDQRPLIMRMLREADLVTVATPKLASLYRSYTRREPVVIRNAVEPELYEPDTERTDERTLALYYGANARLRDYTGAADSRGKWQGGYAYQAVRELRIRSVWLGIERPAPVAFDVLVTYDQDMRRFFRALGNAHADIGLAPLLDEGFNRAKSELHWLEMTAAGLPVIAERLDPYAVIRDGIDGLLVRGAAGWYDGLRKLASEPSLRADMVAAARERLAVDYDPRRRAGEWAEAFRLALEN